MSSNDAERAWLREVKRRLISVSDAAEMSGFSLSHVRNLLDEDVVPGVKLGRNWYTTREAVRAYLQTDRRPGPRTL